MIINSSEHANQQLSRRKGTKMSNASVKTKQQLHEVVSLIEAPLVIVDASGKIEIANQKLCDLLGRVAGSFEGRKFADKFHTGLPEDQLIGKFRKAIEAAEAPWSVNLVARDAEDRDIRLKAKFSVIQPSADYISVLVLLSRIENGDAAKRPPEQSTDAEIRSMVADAAGQFTAGHLEMIGLEEVRMSLGDRWDRLASRVYGIADAILKSRLSNEDVFRRDADGNYIICFAKLCNEQAWFKAKALGQEIRKALLGEDAHDQLADFRLDANTRERISSVRSATYEIRIPSDEIDAIPDVVGLIKDKIASASAQLKKVAASQLRSLAENCAVQFVGVKSIDHKRVPIQRAAFDVISEAQAERLRQIYGNAPKLVEQLDAMLLGGVLERMNQMEPETMPVTVVGVDFQTLASPHSARSYYDIFGSAVGEPAQSLIINVGEIPADLHHGRIAEVLRYLRNYCRYTALRLTKPTLGNINLAESRISLATIDYPDLQLMLRRDTNAVMSLFKKLRQYNVRVAIDNIPGAQCLQALQKVKPDFYTMSPYGDESWRAALPLDS
tara:strand:- start:746 stop:2410 length:1665 start_codon:yes stop_codon:yes gene_type:complete